MAALGEADPKTRVGFLSSFGAPEEVLIELGDETERVAVAEVARGLEHAEMLLPLAIEIDSTLAQSRLHRARAKVLAYAGRFEEALGDCREATRIAEASDHRLEAAQSRLAAVPALAELGRMDEAIAEGETARREFRFANETELAARADTNLGTVHQRRGDPARALTHYDLARPGLADPVTTGQLDSNRGEALLALSDFVGAEGAFLAALRVFEAHSITWGAAIVEGNLADLAARQGRLERALFYYERARRRVESDASPGHLARLLAEQSDAMASLGLIEDAHSGYRHALVELDRHGMALEAARARGGLGLVQLQLGRASEAETTLAAAAKAFEELGHAAAGAQVDLLRGEVAGAHGRLVEARTLMAGALNALRARPLEAVGARSRLARLAMTAGDLDEVLAQLDEAIPIAETLDVAPLLGDLLHTRGQLYRRRNDLEAATRDLDHAVEHVERVRGSLQAQRFRTAFLTQRLTLYEDVAAARLEQGDLPAALVAAERAKSRSLLDAVRGAVEFAEPDETGVGDDAEAALTQEISRLRAEVNALYSQLGTPDYVRDPGAWQTAVRQRERELERTETRLSSTRGVAGLYAQPASLAELQGLLDTDVALVEYFIAGDELIAFIIGHDRLDVQRRLCPSKVLAEQVRRMDFQMNRALRPGAMDQGRGERLTADVLATLRSLHELVWKPLADRLHGVRRVVIVPHGPLHVLPFAALWDGRKHLVELFEVHMAPSATMLAHMASRSPTPSGQTSRAVVVGVADHDAPRILTEARQVAAALGTDELFLGRQASTTRVKSALEHARVVHLACHGRFSPTAPLASGLRLADGWLTVRDIYPLSLDAELVVLSGCETGRNVVSAGDELIGLLRGFVAAGCRALLASHWRVADESTTLFMSTFYGLWNNGLGPTRLGAALRETQIRLLRQQPHPAFWAPFFLVGRP